jgi:predicted DNA-binding protein (MmcQ/YjbR family)
MVTIENLRKIALSFPEAVEAPHFDKTSFRIKNRIFATYDKNNNRACLKLSEIDQDVFSSFDRSIIYPVPNKWGKQGWTFIQLSAVKKDIFIDALTTAYCLVAPKRFAVKVRTTSM